MKNRTAIGIVCIILAVAVTFVVSPLVNNISDKKTEVVRFVADVSHGTEIKDTDVELVKISNSALPEKVIKDKKMVVGKFATADIFKGDFDPLLLCIVNKTGQACDAAVKVGREGEVWFDVNDEDRDR